MLFIHKDLEYEKIFDDILVRVHNKIIIIENTAVAFDVDDDLFYTLLNAEYPTSKIHITTDYQFIDYTSYDEMDMRMWDILVENCNLDAKLVKEIVTSLMKEVFLTESSCRGSMSWQ